MNDVTSSLRITLSKTDNSTPTIQSSASSLMRLYDKSPTLGVSEWRNTLQSCHNSQLLPLLYVANEVLQNSKRNRGNKFLEAFSPVLHDSLKYICERDPTVVEKVRRTAKIWGDRRVFSQRFVADLLNGLEGFRKGLGGQQPQPQQQRRLPPRSSPSLASPNVHSHSASKNETPLKDDNSNTMDTDENFIHTNDAEDNDNSSPFINTGPSLLNINLTINKSIAESTKSSVESKRASFGSKRRRSHESLANSKQMRSSLDKKLSSSSLVDDIFDPMSSFRRKALNSSTLVELLNQLFLLDKQLLSVDGIISSVQNASFLDNDGNDDVVEVGDELNDLNQKVLSSIQTVKDQRKVLYTIAEKKRILEGEIKRYLPWLKNGINTDNDELKFCHGLEKKLLLLKIIHEDAKKARELRREREANEKAIAEKSAREKAEQEELQKSLAETMKSASSEQQTPGMVWNNMAREWQYIDTNETWRD